MEPLRDSQGRLVEPTKPERGHGPGVTIRTEQTRMARKAETTETYTLAGKRFRVRAGDPIPDGAVLDSERKRDPAPDNRALAAPPENREAVVTSEPEREPAEPPKRPRRKKVDPS